MIAWPVRQSTSSLDSTFSRSESSRRKPGGSRAKGDYLLLGGSRLDANSKVVRDGQMKVLQPLIDRGDIRVVADLWVPEWSPTEAYLWSERNWTSSTLLPTGNCCLGMTDCGQCRHSSAKLAGKSACFEDLRSLRDRFRMSALQAARRLLAETRCTVRTSKNADGWASRGRDCRHHWTPRNPVIQAQCGGSSVELVQFFLDHEVASVGLHPVP